MRFFDLTQDLFLMQNVFEVTRMRRGQEPSRLDYVFTLNENEVDNDLEYLAPLGMSDHVGILWKYNCSTQMVHDRNEKRLAYFK